MGISILSLFQTLLHFQETKEGWGEGGKKPSHGYNTLTLMEVTLMEREDSPPSITFSTSHEDDIMREFPVRPSNVRCKNERDLV